MGKNPTKTGMGNLYRSKIISQNRLYKFFSKLLIGEISPKSKGTYISDLEQWSISLVNKVNGIYHS